MKTRRELKKWREWRAAELERDLAYCHPRWPQEAQYLRAEIKAVRNLSFISGSDWWIYFDWAALVLILATIASHVTFFHYSNDISEKVHHYIIIPLLLILWFRIFKYARPFEGAGPFVVIFGSVLGDIVKWGFLNSVIVIPFTCAFWITFGAISLNPVSGYDSVAPLLYNIFSMMVVNDHHYDDLEKANPVMARLLCGSFIGIAAIVTLNLLIALLSNTFERLYENAVANAVMQRARTILLLQKSLRKSQKKKYYDFVKTNGSPEVNVKNLGRLLTMDGDDHATIERVRDDVKVIVGILGEKFGRKFGKGKKSDLDFVKMDVSKIRRFQEELIADVKNMRQAILEITEKLDGIKNMNNENNNNDNNNNMNNNNMNNSNTVSSPSTSLSLQNDKQALKPKLSKIIENSCEDDSDTETSESDSECETKYSRDGKWTKFKKDKHRYRRKSGNSEDLHKNRKENKQKSAKPKHERRHLSPEQMPDTTSSNPYTTYQKLGYPPPPEKSQTPVGNWRNSGFVFGQHDPSNHLSRIQNNYDLQNQIPLKATIGHQVPDGNNQFFTGSLTRNGNPQHLISIENPGLQGIQNYGQQPRQIQKNHRSSLYDLGQPANRYLDKRSLNTFTQPIPLEDMTSLQSSSYTRSLHPTNRFEHPPAIPNDENSFGYQNYAFRPIDQNENQFTPGRNNNGQFAQNTQANDRAGRMTRTNQLHEPIRSQFQPIPTQVTTQNKREVQQRPYTMISYPKIENSGFTQHQTKQKEVPQTPTPDEIPLETEEASADVTDNSSQHEKLAKETVVVQQEINIPEKLLMSTSRENKYETFVADKTELDVSPVGKLDVSLLAPSSVTNERKWYDQYRPSTPIAPVIMEKVVYFQEKIDKSGASTNTDQTNEMKMSREITDYQRSEPVSEHPEQSPKETVPDKISHNDVSAPKVSSSMAEQDPENEAESPKSSTAGLTESTSHGLADDPDNTTECEADEGARSKKSLEQSQGATEDPQDLEVNIQHSSEASKVTDDNEIPEEVSSQEKEKDIVQLTLEGVNTDPVQDIGWV